MPNSSSNRITNSTVSSESAPRSSLDRAFVLLLYVKSDKFQLVESFSMRIKPRQTESLSHNGLRLRACPGQRADWLRPRCSHSLRCDQSGASAHSKLFRVRSQ